MKLTGCSRICTTAYHPATNELIQRWHRSLKTAITRHNNANWVDILPTVLLRLRVSYKEDLRASAAEMLYGSALKLPDEFFIEKEASSNPQFFIENLENTLETLNQYLQHIIPNIKCSCTKHYLAVRKYSSG